MLNWTEQRLHAKALEIHLTQSEREREGKGERKRQREREKDRVGKRERERMGVKTRKGTEQVRRGTRTEIGEAVK